MLKCYIVFMFYCIIKVFLIRVCIYIFGCIVVGKIRVKKEYLLYMRDDRYKWYVDDFYMILEIKKKNDNDLLIVFFFDRGMRVFSKN